MADTYEKDLAQKSSLTTSDFIRVVGSDNVSYKQLVSDVAKKMIELTAPSGSLLDIALNDSICPTGFVKTLSPRNTTASALPSTECLYGTVYVNKRTATAITVVIICESKSIYINTYTGSWSGWTLMPTRAEVDALKTYTSYTHKATVGSVSFQVLTRVYCDGLKIVQLSSTSSVSLSTSGWANAVSNYPISLTTIAIATGKGEIMVRTSGGALQINATDFSGYLLGTGVTY